MSKHYTQNPFFPTRTKPETLNPKPSLAIVRAEPPGLRLDADSLSQSNTSSRLRRDLEAELMTEYA